MRSKSSLVFSQPLVLEAFDKFKQKVSGGSHNLHKGRLIRPCAVKMNCGGAHLASDASVGVKSIIYEAAMSINIPPEIQGTQQACWLRSSPSAKSLQARASNKPAGSTSSCTG
ncbi:hypothetical protein WJX77_005581 [Trebouxia sp. C0004]